jgi:hypothetical protein
LWVRGSHFRRGGEVVGERRVGFDGDDLVVLGPDLREQGALEHGKRVFLASRLVTSQPWAQKYVENRGAIKIRSVEDILARLRSPTAVEQLSAGRQQLAQSSREPK